MFIGRKKELKILNDLYNSNHFEFVVITGRRRIGKSTLLAKFISHKPCIFLNAVESKGDINLTMLSQAYDDLKGIQTGRIFSSYLQAFKEIFKLSLKEKFIFIIDEYPYLVDTDPSISSILQMLIDQYKEESKMMFIISGSSISFMENKVLAYKAPLFGRKTAQLKIEPLSFQESLPYLKNYSNQDKVLFYSAYGGTPYYLNQIDPTKSFKANIKNTFLKSSSFISDEPNNLLKQEVYELSSYAAVLYCIANGATKFNEIVTKTGFSSGHIGKLTKSLIELNIIFKETPYKFKGDKKSLYKLSDNFFSFWFRFIPLNQSLIVRELEETAYKRIEPYLNEYVGPIFEDLAKEYLWLLLREDSLPVIIDSLGRWWGNDPKTKAQTEIDIVGYSDKDTALFGECKWSNEKVRSKTIRQLIEKSQLFTHPFKHYYIFAKSGFTKGALDLAQNQSNIHLITLEDMIEKFESYQD